MTDLHKIGFIGTGVMGHPMCQHLLKTNHTIFVHTRTKAKADGLIDQGALWCASVQEIAQACDVIITMLGYPDDVRSVYLGSHGLMNHINDGCILIDMTTTKPQLAKEISSQAKLKRAYALDAPVSGGDVGAQKGTLSIMVGGDQKIVKKVMPILKVFGQRIVHQGPSGAGQHTKMTNQIVIASTMMGVCEALAYALSAGLDPERVLESISQGAASCWTLDNLVPRILREDYEPGFFIDHFVKDMAIALEEAARIDLSLGSLKSVHDLYVSMQKTGYGKKGTQALFLALKRASKT